MSSLPRRSSSKLLQSRTLSSWFLSLEDVRVTSILLLKGYKTDPRLDDESYRAAKLLAEDGSLGEIHAVETSCLDQQDPTGKQFSPALGETG